MFKNKNVYITIKNGFVKVYYTGPLKFKGKIIKEVNYV